MGSVFPKPQFPLIPYFLDSHDVPWICLHINFDNFAFSFNNKTFLGDLSCLSKVSNLANWMKM